METQSKKCGRGHETNYSEIFNEKSINEVPITFNVPQPPSYRIKLHDISKTQYGRCCIPLSFRVSDSFKSSNFPEWLTFTSFKIEIPSKHKEFIVALHIENKAAIQSKHNKEDLLIYSHENNVDVFTILPHLADLSIQLKCNILAYDYSGFGRSEGSPSISNMKSNISLILDYANHDMNIPYNRIILYGIDIGAYPSIHIGTNICYRGLKAIIIVSPILGSTASDIRRIVSPLLVIHPRNDKVVSSASVSDLIRGMRNQVDWYPKARDIGEILQKHRYKFYMKIKGFIEQTERMHYAVRETMRNVDNVFSDVVYVEYKGDGGVVIKENCFKLGGEDESVDCGRCQGSVRGNASTMRTTSDVHDPSCLMSHTQSEFSRKSGNCSICQETYFNKNIFDSEEEDEINSVVQNYY